MKGVEVWTPSSYLLFGPVANDPGFCRRSRRRAAKLAHLGHENSFHGATIHVQQHALPQHNDTVQSSYFHA